jgi:predicted GNAT family N-acyltransferase
MTYLTEPLNSTHKKSEFSCKNLLLDEYLKKQAKQDVKRMLSACFVLKNADNQIIGYYTLSSLSIKKENLSEEITRKLPPNYENLPVTLLGRLAVDEKFKGQKFGELLLIDALKRCLFTSINSIGSMAVVVDPIDENAVKFYKKYDFIELKGSGKMFLEMATISKLFDL